METLSPLSFPAGKLRPRTVTVEPTGLESGRTESRGSVPLTRVLPDSPSESVATMSLSSGEERLSVCGKSTFADQLPLLSILTSSPLLMRLLGMLMSLLPG